MSKQFHLKNTEVFEAVKERQEFQELLIEFIA